MKIIVFVCSFLLFQTAHAQLSGTVFKDYDGSGAQTATNPFEPGVSGVTVRLFVGSNPTPFTAVTGATGIYNFTAVQAPKDSMARIEFINLPDAYAAGMVGAQSMSDVRFLKLPAANINLGIMTDDEYCVVGKGLTVATPCFVAGDPLAGGTAGEGDAFVQFDYNASGQTSATNFPVTHLASAKQVGSLWSSAYQKSTKQLVLGAMVRRHVGLGPLGTGGIYKLDLKTMAVSNFLDVKTIGIPTGNDPHTGLSANKEDRSHDSLTFIKTAKVGLAGIQFSRYQDTMFVVNLNDRKLYSFRVDKPLAPPTSANAALKSYNIPHPNCSNNDFAPWALKQQKGKYYLGVVCTAETSQDTNDLKAAVYDFSPKTGTFTKLLEFPLNFKRDPMDATGPDCIKYDHWLPWTNKFPASCSGVGGPGFVMYPQPLLSDIEFDDDGSMILGFVDRFGFQAGQDQWGIAKNDTAHYYGFMGGDTYRAQLTPTGFVIESNGKSGALTGCGVGKGTGIGGGEFFCDDEWHLKLGGPAGHQEITNGGIFKQPGKKEILVSAMDPVDTVFLSAGFRAFSTTDGKMSRGFSLYSNMKGSLGKSGGTGDLTGLCEPAPLEIGNRVWLDKNKNGIQDPNEKGVDGIILTLHDMQAGGAKVASYTTANGGQYYFNDSNVPNSLLRRHKYEVRLSMKQPLPVGLLAGAGMLKDSLAVTVQNATGFTDPTLRDSDAKMVVDSLVVPVMTQESGENSYTFDIGMKLAVTCAIRPNAGKDTTVCSPNIKLKSAAIDENWSFLSSNVATTPTIDKNGNVAGMNVSGTYRFLLTNTVGCKDTVVVTKNTFTIIPMKDDTICIGTKVTFGFGASATISYLWNTGATTSTISVTPKVTTDYSVILTSSLSKCSVSDTIRIVVGTKPDAGKDTTICATNSIKLKTPLANESWKFIQGPAAATATISANGMASGMTANGYYYFELTNKTFGCTDTIAVRRSSVSLGAYITQPTCKNNVPQEDGTVGLTLFTAGAKYALGSNVALLPTVSTGLPVVPAGGILANNISTANSQIIVRLFHPTSTCYRDTTLYIKVPNCGVPCVKSSFTLTPQSATCSGATVNADAKILVTGIANGTAYSYGIDSTAFSFASSTVIAANSITVSNLINPTAPKTYFVRVYNGAANCYTTQWVTIQPTNCTLPCVKPTFALTPASASCNGTVAKNDAQIIVSGISNGVSYSYGTDTTAFNYASAVAFAGNGFTIANIANPVLPKTCYVRIYNGSAKCYLTKSVIIQPTDCSQPCVKPSFSVISSSATCNGLIAKNDAQIVVTGASNGLTYSYGTDSTAFSFATSVAYTGNTFTIPNIANPATVKTYFVRIYNGAAACYLTKLVTLKPTDCMRKFDLELTKSVVGDCRRQVGDVVQYKVIIKSIPIPNGSTADSVFISDTLVQNLTFLSAKASHGSYDNTTHIWGMLQIPQGGSDTLTITAKINAFGGFEGGTVCNVAQVHKAKGMDIDSNPGNNIKSEDDYSSACVSVPFKICTARKDTIIISAPAGYATYQWFKNGTKIVGATKSTLEVGEAGAYTVEAANGACLSKNCCPAYVIDDCQCPAEICVPFNVKQTKSKGKPVK